MPIKGTRAVLTPETFSRQSSFAQPKGSSLPFRSRIASLRLGGPTRNPTASPFSSTMLVSLGLISGFSYFAR
jgi:hypothetical protein